MPLFGERSTQPHMQSWQNFFLLLARDMENGCLERTVSCLFHRPVCLTSCDGGSGFRGMAPKRPCATAKCLIEATQEVQDGVDPTAQRQFMQLWAAARHGMDWALRRVEDGPGSAKGANSSKKPPKRRGQGGQQLGSERPLRAQERPC
ncbi:hypothetical protein NDU88_000149 [Pleurodeles waltl]|uniref:Uncharacterized protein n=1 Tax=Pleurodeles waltl TaxID=8319 RepID=A0AAV7TE50_PLEWA|nr:hypothetical protein NDU88_000149 [Pleurodeles waltl]